MNVRRQLADDIRRQIGDFPSFTEVAGYLGLSPKTARVFLSDLPSFRIGQKKCYFPADLARKLESVRVEPKV